MKKKITAIFLALSFTTSNAFASILGSQLVDKSSILMAEDTTLYHNTFMSDQEGVGLQREYYAEYKPNEKIKPIVVTGETIWGKRTINEALDYMKNNNMYPMLGINASFFSLQTGIPMGHVITDGEITSKDGTELDAVGFFEDGSGFISKLGIKTMAYFDEYEFEIPHINKYSQETTSIVTLFTDKFGDTTEAVGETTNIILGDIQGKLSIGETILGRVEDIIVSETPVEIPEGKFVLTINNASANDWIKSVWSLIEIGEQITINNEATTDGEKWTDVQNGLASEGKRLITDGVVNPELEKGAAPRTAVGVKEDGTIVFYVIDGRQPDYSYGVKQSTLAERMAELGCVDALNLDGGGSTTIAGIYPGQNVSSVINSPSDKVLRKVTNFIFLQNMQKPSGKIGGIYIYPYQTHYLSGVSVKLSAGAVDTNYHYMDVPEIVYSPGNNLVEIMNDGVVTFRGNGEAIVNASYGNIDKSESYFVYDEPTSIRVYDKDLKKEIKSLSVDRNSSLSLEAYAYHGEKRLISLPEQYKWEIDKELGTIDGGIVTITGKEGTQGNITVTAEKTKCDIPVSINISEEIKPLEWYPRSEITLKEDNIHIDIYTSDDTIDFENSYVKIDGKIVSDGDTVLKYEEDKNHGVIVIPVENTFKNEYHKIMIFSRTSNGYSALNGYTIDKEILKNPFIDIENHWAKNVISYMSEQKIVNGIKTENGFIFNADNGMTRAEFAVMMSNFYGEDPDDYKNDELLFEDENIIPKWAENYIKAMVKKGVISGKADGEKVYFAPNDKITRAEAASIIGRGLPEELRVGELDFLDADDIPKWAKKHMAILTNAGFLRGYPDGTLKPGGYVTRAEAVSMLFNIY